MMNFFDSLCGCFSPQLKQNIIEYLSSAKLNRLVLEEQKCSQQKDAPQQSIYAQVKTKSYYFMKLKQDQDHSHTLPKAEQAQIYDNSLQPNYYPKQLDQTNDLYDQVYSKKLASLQSLLKMEVGNQYSKIYDSQDDMNLKIYCKQQIYQSKRFNSYRFGFNLSQNTKITPQDFLNLQIPKQAFNIHEPLLTYKQHIITTENQLEINHRCYKKVLVINPHDFYTAEKSQIVEEQNKEVVYNTIFSVKGNWQKLPDHSQGWINLVGLRISKQSEEEGEQSTSLRQQEHHVHFQGYINIQLELSINANMLKQPVAKQIRVYIQKLVCSLTKSDAI